MCVGVCVCVWSTRWVAPRHCLRVVCRYVPHRNSFRTRRFHGPTRTSATAGAPPWLSAVVDVIVPGTLSITIAAAAAAVATLQNPHQKHPHPACIYALARRRRRVYCVIIDENGAGGDGRAQRSHVERFFILSAVPHSHKAALH